MGTTRRGFVGSGLAIAGAASIVSGRSLANTRAGGRVLRFVPEFDLRILDPIANTGLSTLQHGHMIFDTLFAFDRSLTARPQMVERFEVSQDGTVYTFVLRDGLRFHDGQPVRARDCVASVRRWSLRDVTGRAINARMTGLDALDDRTFRLTLRERYPLVIDALAKMASSPCFIMREQEAQTPPTTPVTEAIGSGPFRMVRAEFQPGNKIVYERNPDYVPRSDPTDGYAGAKIVNVDRVEWNIIADPSTQTNALLAGEVDIVNTPTFDLLPSLRRSRDVVVKVLDSQGWLPYLRPNHLHPPFNDVRARRALALMVNQTDYLSAAAGDRENWRSCHAFMACGSPMGSEAGMDAYRQPNLDRARALMQEAGYNGEPIVVLNYNDNAILGAVTEVTMGQLRKIGVNVRAETTDLATAFARRAKIDPPLQGGWHIFHTRSLGLELNSPLTNFPLSAPCGRDAQGVPQSWFGWPCDQPLEDLRAAWAMAPTLEERRRIGEQIQLRAAEFLPYIPLGQLYTPVAHRANIRGLIEMPIPVMWNVSIG
jgi:peptide/nickel transport system substrate-binding protein